MNKKPTRRLPKREFSWMVGHYLNHAHRVMGSPLPLAVVGEVRKAAKSHINRLRSYGWMGRNGYVQNARSKEYLICRSWGSRILAVLEGYPKHKPKISFEQVKSLANETYPRLPSDEFVAVRDVPKADGGKRPIMLFGPIARANQCVARALIVARVGHSEFEYARRGRGRDAAVRHLCLQHLNDGIRAFGTLDIKNFFPSLTKEAAYSSIPISKSIIDSAIFIHPDTAIALHTDVISEIAVRSGLPQGAKSSVIVAGKIIQPLLNASPAKCKGSYIDDVFIGGSNVAEVDAHLDALASSLMKHPGSPLFLKCRMSAKTGERTNFLGYWLGPNPIANGGGLKVRPSGKALRRLYVRLAALFICGNIELGDDETEKIVKNWAASFGLWTHRDVGAGIALLVFEISVAPLLEGARENYSAALKLGCESQLLESLTRKVASELVPPCVLARKSGACFNPFFAPSPKDESLGQAGEA